MGWGPGMKTEYLVSWQPPDDLLAMLRLHEPDIRPWAHQYESAALAREHTSRALITLTFIFREAGPDLSLAKIETTEVQYGA